MSVSEHVRYKMKRNAMGEVALRELMPDSSYVDKITKIASETDIPARLILEIKSGGTAFIIKKCRYP